MMMTNLSKRVLYIATTLFMSMVAEAQIVTNEMRRTEGGELRTTQLLQLPTYRVPAFDLDSALMAMEERSAELRTYHFAHTVETDIDIIKEGTHTTWADGTEVWRYRVRSTGAKSLGFFFEDFELPQGALLYIYSTSDQENMIGGFGAENNNQHRSLPIQPILADDVVIELQSPRGSQPKLRLTELSHGVRSIEWLLRTTGPRAGTPASMSCIPEVACHPEYRDIAQSVVIILTSDGAIGTGSLVNNSAHDGRPLVLTASHVFAENFKHGPRDFKALAERLSERAIFFFNFQTPMCDSSIQPSGLQSVANATLVGFHQHSDIALVELSQRPPVAYRAHYAGWSAEPNINEAHANIHHPYGYTKRINFTLSPLKWVTYPGAPNYPPFGADQHLMVRNWDIGSTQPGSSGSPLLDSQHKIIGVLSGGFSECHNTQSDYFAVLRQLWHANDGDKAEAEKIISALDPVSKGGNTSCVALGGDKGGATTPVRLTNMTIPPSNKSLLEQLPQLERSTLLGTGNGVTAVGESFRVPAGSHVYGVYLMLKGSVKSEEKLLLTIYGEGGSIKLPTREVSMDMNLEKGKSFSEDPNRLQELFVSFDTPMEVVGEETLIIALETQSIPEGVSLVHQQKDDARANTMMWQVGGKWVPFTQQNSQTGVSLWIDPLVSHAQLKTPEVEEPRVKLLPHTNPDKMILKLNGKGPYHLNVYTLLGEPVYSDSAAEANIMIIPRKALEGAGLLILKVEGDGWSESIKAYFPKN